MGSVAAPGGYVCVWPENLWSGHRGPIIYLHCVGGYSCGYMQALPINGEQLKGIYLMTVEQRGCSVWAFLPTLLFFFKYIFFLCGPFSLFKVLLILLQYCFCFVFWIFGLKACEVSAPQAGLEIVPLALEENNHWTSEIPLPTLISVHFLVLFVCFQDCVRAEKVLIKPGMIHVGPWMILAVAFKADDASTLWTVSWPYLQPPQGQSMWSGHQ